MRSLIPPECKGTDVLGNVQQEGPNPGRSSGTTVGQVTRSVILGYRNLIEMIYVKLSNQLFQLYKLPKFNKKVVCKRHFHLHH